MIIRDFIVIQEENLTEQTVTAILEMIGNSSLEEGDFFATEKQLEEQFRISRPVLREAISRIRALGFLRSKQRKGLIVSKPDPVRSFEQAFRYGVMDAIDISELAELRYSIEVGSVELSVFRADIGQIDQLHLLAEEYELSTRTEHPDRDQDRIELDFHRILLEASGNRMLSRMHYVLTAFFSRAEIELPGWERVNHEEKGIWEHRAIADAVGMRNAERARMLLSIHLEGLIRRSSK